MKTHTLLFTRTEDLQVVNIAVLTLETKTDMTQAAAKGRFVMALSEWGKNSEAGKQAWKDSDQNFNIGDFAHHDNDRDLKAVLAAEDITSATIEVFSADESHDYDEVLVTGLKGRR